MLKMIFEEEVPPKEVAKRLRVAPVTVYRTSELLRKRLRSVVAQALKPEGLNVQIPLGPAIKKKRIDDPIVHMAIQDYFEKFGLHEISLRKVQDHITSFIPDRAPIRQHDISFIMKKVYHLDYKHLDPAQFRYRDPYYDEKRIWASRLLA